MKVESTANEYKAPFWAINGHFSTIINALLRKQPPISYQKEVFHFQDNDKTQLCWLKNNHRQLIVIVPGMGSEASRNYITNTAYQLHQHKYDILVPEHRDTSIPNTKLQSYHSANYEDLKEIIDHISSDYDHIHLVGYCLGGSIALNYISRYADKIDKTITISAPLELRNASLALEQKNNFLYQRRFVKNLKSKLSKKATLYPEKLSLSAIQSCQTVRDIDNAYTAPVNGFKNAEDYYEYGSACNFIDSFSSPLLIISSKDDSFIPISSATIKKLQSNTNITTLITETGGHVAFPNKTLKGMFWHENQILKFLK